jgi:hypothetical protein
MWYSERDSSQTQVYRRKLPSGGYIAISMQPVQTLFGPAKMRGHVVVERRAEERRAGHAPPIAAVAEHEDVKTLIAALVPVAESDEMLEQALARGVTIPVPMRRLPS